MLTEEEKELRKEGKTIKQVLRLLTFLNKKSIDELKCHNCSYSIHVVKLDVQQ